MVVQVPIGGARKNRVVDIILRITKRINMRRLLAASALRAGAGAAAAPFSSAAAAPPPRCVFQTLTPELVPSAIECVAETFGGGAVEDPFSWLFNLKKHHWRSMTSPFIERAAEAVPLRPRLSVVALNALTRKVEGVMVNEDWVTPRPQVYRSRLPSDWWPTRAAFAELHARFVDERPGAIERGTTIRVMYFSCVHPGARGEGIMRGLWRNTVTKARENGYSHITAQASSASVRNILHSQLGFEEVASLSYGSWEYPEPPIGGGADEAAAAAAAAAAADAPAAAADSHGIGRASRVLEELSVRNAAEYDRLSISIRRVPSNLYV